MMRSSLRHGKLNHGKVNPMAVALLPPIIFLAGLMVYSAFRTVVPSALSIAKTQQVEAMEVIKGVSPVTQKGLEIPQATSLRGSGSSRLVIARPASDGAFLLVSGTVSAGFLADKVELDRMLHLKFTRKKIRIESDGQPVDAVLLFARTETNPLIVNDPNTNPEISADDLLFTKQTILPVPGGILYDDRYESDNGMTIAYSMSVGTNGLIPQLNFQLDPDSTAWIEMPKTVRVQHKAIGTEDLQLGILIPLDDSGSGSFTISMFDEEIATVSRP